MKHILIFLVMILTLSLTYGQKQKVSYLDSNFQPASQSFSLYECIEGPDGNLYKKTIRKKVDNSLIFEYWFKTKRESRRLGNFVEEKAYDENGQLISQIKKDRSKRSRKVKEYYPNGKLRSVLEENKDFTGLDESYFENGSLKHRAVWNDTRPLSYYLNYPNSQPRIQVEFDSVEFKYKDAFKFFYPDGKLMAKFLNGPSTSKIEIQVFDRMGQLIPSEKVDSLLPTIAITEFNALMPLQKNDSNTDLIESSPSNMNIVMRSIGYPKPARDSGIQGVVILRMLLDNKGNPQFFYPLNIGHRILFDSVALKAMNLRFEPAMKDGRKVSCWINIPFNFKLID
ncbi:MAG: energy transducer TonB [Bacteroidia bacterium]|nr:energy transducer TonB [Bacteroidia bacterium]